jgi:hypothetical protein
MGLEVYLFSLNVVNLLSIKKMFEKILPAVHNGTPRLSPALPAFAGRGSRAANAP